MRYIGIDPGANGGIGVIDTDEGAYAYPYSDFALRMILIENPKAKVMLEKVGARPGQGVVAMFNFGKAYGYILGELDALLMTYELVSPAKWKREFSVTSDKQTSIDCCRRLFPLVDLRKSERARTDHDGMAEALLIAEYARRHMR